jgi:hypothetical protein
MTVFLVELLKRMDSTDEKRKHSMCSCIITMYYKKSNKS